MALMSELAVHQAGLLPEFMHAERSENTPGRAPVFPLSHCLKVCRAHLRLCCAPHLLQWQHAGYMWL